MEGPPSKLVEPRMLGRYAIYDEIASGGMATVHFGRLLGLAGFSRTVAIKRLHPQFCKDPSFVSMFLDEARLAGRIRHPNVVSILDVVASDGELFLVMDYVHGASLARLCTLSFLKGPMIPLPITAAIVTGVLYGLHAAHEAKNELGEPLGLVHRDVSPQNVVVGTDGVPCLLDFGIAKAVGRLQATREGQLKGKLGYMAPEQILRRQVDRRTDIYAAAVVLWQMLTCRRLFEGDEASLLYEILEGDVAPPSSIAPEVPGSLDRIVLRALSRTPGDRFASALAMAQAIEEVAPRASPAEVGAWVLACAGRELDRRADTKLSVERSPAVPAASGAPPAETEKSEAASVAVAARPSAETTLLAPPAPSARTLRWAARWVGPAIGVAGLAALVLARTPEGGTDVAHSGGMRVLAVRSQAIVDAALAVASAESAESVPAAAAVPAPADAPERAAPSVRRPGAAGPSRSAARPARRPRVSGEPDYGF